MKCIDCKYLNKEKLYCTQIDGWMKYVDTLNGKVSLGISNESKISDEDLSKSRDCAFYEPIKD